MTTVTIVGKQIRDELKRLTDDHSWVQEQVNAGILSEDEAKSHPLKNVVTRALGGALAFPGPPGGRWNVTEEVPMSLAESTVSVMLPIPTEWWLRPLSRAARVGEQIAVTWKRL